MRTGRVIGWALVWAALAALGWDLAIWARSGSYAALLPGQLWASIDRPGLNLVQAVIQRYVLPELWDWVLLPILLAPLWLVLALPGLVLAILCRRRGRAWFRKKR